MELLLKVIPADNILFASETVGALRGIYPEAGRRAVEFIRGHRSASRRHPASFALTSRFRLTFCSAACKARSRCKLGGMRTRNSPL